MCGRFVNLTKINSIKKKFNIENSISKDLVSYNIAPSHSSCIIFRNDVINLDVNLDIAKWGYSFIDKKDKQEKYVINSRLETINNKIQRNHWNNIDLQVS